MAIAASGRRLGVLLAFVLLAASATVRAAPLDDEKQARAHYDRAEKSFDLGKFGDALADYQSAYEAKPLPGFLFNIAQCYRNMGKFERARFFFRRYLALEPHAPNRFRVEELIAEMSKQLEAQAAAPAPAVEPKPVEAPPLVTPLAPAPAAAPPPPPPAAVAADRAPLPPTGAVPVVTATAPPPAQREAQPLWRNWWFWTGVGAVVAGGIAAT
ncbi:MAG TPA: tetratricopeptide repeat protein, partial [Polyangia bacterium]|nr:tetratricopeptide repeat protein [Polyangia bacterium]